MVSITIIEVLFRETISKPILKKPKKQFIYWELEFKEKRGRCEFLSAEALKCSVSMRLKYSKKRMLETQNKEILINNIFMDEPTAIWKSKFI